VKLTGGITLALAAFLSTSVSAHWSPVNDPGEFDGIEIFLAHGDALHAGTTFGQVYQTPDHGVSWEAVGTGLEPGYAPVSALAVAGDWMIMSRGVSQTHNFRCRFDGQQWTEWLPLANQEDQLFSLATIGDSFFTVLGASVCRSDDFGVSWTPLPSPPGVNLWEVFSHGSRLFGSMNVINGGEIYRFEEATQTWTPIGTPLGSSYVLAHTGFQGALLVSVYHGAGLGSLWRSTDLGDHWTRVLGLPTQQNLNGLAVLGPGGQGLAIGASGANEDGESVFVSFDLQDWTEYTTDLPVFARPVNMLAAHDGWIFKTGGSVTAYRVEQPATPASVGNGVAAGGSRPLAAEPNPFGPATRISYRVAQAGPVELAVYDPQGRMIRSLVSGESPIGEHAFVWDGRDASGEPVAAGVYIVKLNGAGAASSQKILRLR
jgi:hypothetical protein